MEDEVIRANVFFPDRGLYYWAQGRATELFNRKGFSLYVRRLIEEDRNFVEHRIERKRQVHELPAKAKL
jgi:hypothetical protein